MSIFFPPFSTFFHLENICHLPIEIATKKIEIKFFPIKIFIENDIFAPKWVKHDTFSCSSDVEGKINRSQLIHKLSPLSLFYSHTFIMTYDIIKTAHHAFFCLSWVTWSSGILTRREWCVDMKKKLMRKALVGWMSIPRLEDFQINFQFWNNFKLKALIEVPVVKVELLLR